jgi:hypothetical protein
VDGTLPAGAGISVIQVCPSGSALDRADTGFAGGGHDKRLKVTSREYWPAGMVTRYLTTKRISDGVGVANVIICKASVPSSQTVFKGAAKTDLRVWGPAPAKVELVNFALVAVTDDMSSEYLFRTAIKAAGVDSHPASLKNSLRAVQEVLEDDSPHMAVMAAGTTRQEVRRGTFVSMRNNYRFRADLTNKVDF